MNPQAAHARAGRPDPRTAIQIEEPHRRFRSNIRLRMLAILFLCDSIFPPAVVHAQKITRVGFLILGYDLEDLPEDPTVKQQIEAGQHQIAILKSDEPSFDSNQEMVEYLNAIVGKLLRASHHDPPFPIEVHFSAVPRIDAQSLPGGPIVVEERMFDHADTEALLVAVLAPETEHQLHNDFLVMWADYKRKQVNPGSVNEVADSRANETSADLEGARLMYEVRMGPAGEWWIFIDGVRLERVCHIRQIANESKRLEALLAKLPPKSVLIRDSERFRELKQKY